MFLLIRIIYKTNIWLTDLSRKIDPLVKKWENDFYKDFSKKLQ